MTVATFDADAQALLVDLGHGMIAIPVGQPIVLERLDDGFVVRRLRQSKIQCGELTIDLVAREVLYRGWRMAVRGRAFELLVLLARTPGRAVHRDVITSNVWSHGYSSNVIERTIADLRKVLGAERIATVSGFGYRLESA